MQYDAIFRNATLIDGTGDLPFTGDLAIADDLIAAIGDLSQAQAGVEIDCTGKTLAPGFIDPHVHYDEALLVEPHLPYVVSQGVTTIINGNCGFSIAPLRYQGALPLPFSLIIHDKVKRFARFSAYQAAIKADPPAVNTGCLIGHSSLRLNNMADVKHPADQTELKAMGAELDQALADGGIGFSTGTFYPTAQAAPTAEIITLAHILKSHGKCYTTHMRDEADGVIDAVTETLAIGAASQCSVHISHHKCAGLTNHSTLR